MSIPDWNIHGVVPPIRPGRSEIDSDRSPYHVDISALVERFAMTSHRRNIFRGLLRFRGALASINIRNGFQWIDGSFLEDVEHMRERPPGDIDVVTFTELGDAPDQQRLLNSFPQLFNRHQVKAEYHVDHYFVNLSGPQNAATVRRVSYWYSMWSHRRKDQTWKGFVEVALNPGDDTLMLDYLDTLDPMKTAPGDAS
jgi:hypothetical protein